MRPGESWSPSLERPIAEAPVGTAAETRRRLPILNVLLFAVTLVTTTIAGAFNADIAPAEIIMMLPALVVPDTEVSMVDPPTSDSEPTLSVMFPPPSEPNVAGTEA